MEQIISFETEHTLIINETAETVSGEKAEQKAANDKKWVRCRNCHFKITQLSDMININSAATHIFKNPAGIFFRVICFSEAPGSIIVSDYTEENTWFSGYLWSISLCRACNSHIGWHYTSGSAEFFGLIADRLTGV